MERKPVLFDDFDGSEDAQDNDKPVSVRGRPDSTVFAASFHAGEAELGWRQVVKWPFALFIACLTALSLSACSSNDKTNVETATKICNDTLKQASDQDFEAMLKRDSRSADTAASLAEEDAKWSGLAAAISDTASLAKEVQGAVEGMTTDDTGAGFQRAQQVLDDLVAAKRDVLSECRKVKASGGKVSQKLMDNYIK